jgi:hypothetical protein
MWSSESASADSDSDYAPSANEWIEEGDDYEDDNDDDKGIEIISDYPFIIKLPLPYV